MLQFFIKRNDFLHNFTPKLTNYKCNNEFQHIRKKFQQLHTQNLKTNRLNVNPNKTQHERFCPNEIIP